MCVPVTTTNLRPGSDCIGLVVNWSDEPTPEASGTGGISIEVTGEGAHQVPCDESYLVVTVLLHTPCQWGVTSPGGLVLRAHSTTPHSCELGPSAVAMVAGCALVHGIAFPGRELDQAKLTRISSLLEEHPDNAGVAVWGDATLAWLDGERVELIQLRPAEGLWCLVFVPDLEVLIADARAASPDVVTRRGAVAQAIVAASLPLALK